VNNYKKKTGTGRRAKNNTPRPGHSNQNLLNRNADRRNGVQRRTRSIPANGGLRFVKHAGTSGGYTCDTWLGPAPRRKMNETRSASSSIGESETVARAAIKTQSALPGPSQKNPGGKEVIGHRCWALTNCISCRARAVQRSRRR